MTKKTGKTDNMDIEIYEDYTHSERKLDTFRVDKGFLFSTSLIGIVCTRGSGTYKFHLNDIEIRYRDVLIIPPNVAFQPVRHSDDFMIHVIRIGDTEFHIVDEITFRPQFELLLSGVPHLRISKTQLKMTELIMRYLTSMLADENNETEDGKIYIDLIIRHYVTILFLEISHLISIQEKGFRIHAKEDNISKKFFKILAKNYMNRHSVSFYAEEIGITTRKLSELIMENTGKSASQWIDQFTLMQAKRMLLTMDMTIQDISYDLNFSTPSHFSKFFKEKTGMTPSEFIKKAGNQDIAAACEANEDSCEFCKLGKDRNKCKTIR